ncbi:hypothetical protein F8388_003930 [Cannabis sativa]|uniref:Uncharacterized protein n=1 Tax=Cannabis sativa TaxID=3483 RepID=A0A7J6GNW1_CANSA|nr:hypothetical protein F8388_003930 [Cannabis sativa]
MAETKGFGVDVRAHTVEIHLGVTKIVIRGSGSMELSLDELELDMWSSGEVWGDGIGKSMGPKRQQWRGFALHLNEMWGLNSCPFGEQASPLCFDSGGDGGQL